MQKIDTCRRCKPVHIGEQSQAESVVVVVWRVGEPVNDHRVVVGMVHLTNSAVQLVVSDGGPESWFLIFNLGNYCSVKEKLFWIDDFTKTTGC